MTRLKCNLLKTTEDGQEIILTLILEDSKVSVSHAENEFIAKGVLSEEHLVGGKMIGIAEDPEGWFLALPKTYTGSYLRAQILPG